MQCSLLKASNKVGDLAAAVGAWWVKCRAMQRIHAKERLLLDATSLEKPKDTTLVAETAAVFPLTSFAKLGQGVVCRQEHLELHRGSVALICLSLNPGGESCVQLPARPLEY